MTDHISYQHFGGITTWGNWQNGCGWWELWLLHILLPCFARYWIMFSTSSRM